MEISLLASICCLAGVQVSLSEEVDWCNLNCGKEQNTMCKYKPQTKAGTCENIADATTPGMRKNLLHMHNTYRNKIASGEMSANNVVWPSASNMRVMSWDYDLEHLALRWAQQCIDSPPHDKCRKTKKFQYVGQNKGSGWDSTKFPAAEGSFKGWFSEISLANPSIVDKLAISEALHFTQVVWAGSFKLGCAAIHAKDTSKPGMDKLTTIVCNYGPGGNTIGNEIYHKGAPCSGCPETTSCVKDSSYPKLCAAKDDPRKPEDIPDSCNNLRLFGMRPQDSKVPMSLLLWAISNFIKMKILE